MVNTRFAGLLIKFTLVFSFAGAAASVELVLATETEGSFCQQPMDELSNRTRHDHTHSSYDTTAKQLNWVSLTEAFSLPTHSQPTHRQKLCGGYYQSFAPMSLDAQPMMGNLYAAADRYTMTRLGEGELCGNVLLQQDDLQMSSDYVKINMANDSKAKSAEFFGEVRLLSKEAMVVGEHAQTDLSNKVTSLDYPEFLLIATQARGTAQKITHLGKTHTLIEQGNYTSCPPGHNEWMLRGHHFDLDHESGWGEVEHMRLQAGYIPIFYVPYFRFPIDDRRHTGFLYPEINNLSQPDIGLPLYWNLHPQLDLVTTPRKIGGRGVMLENSLRYMADPSPQIRNNGHFFATYLPDDKAADDNNRSRFSWQHNSRFSPNVFAFIDLNSVSDNEYFDDFGTDLAANQTSYLNRLIGFSYIKNNWSADLLIDSPEIIDNAIAASDKPYQKLPELVVAQQSLIADRINWYNSASVGYFSQPDALDIPYGQRLHINSQLQLRMTSLWGFFIPSVRLQNTDYQLDTRDPTDSEHLSRTLPTYNLDTGLIFERELNNQFTQTLEPRLFYTHTPYTDQQDLPNFDTTDLTFSWEQLFRDNRFSGIDRLGDTEQTTLALSSQILDNSMQTQARFTVGQIFYHEDQRVALKSNPVISQPRSPLVAITEWRLTPTLATQSGITWNADDNLIQEGFAGVQYSPAAQQRWNAAYRYQAATAIDQIDVSMQYPIALRWQWLARWNLDLRQERTLEQISGLQYDSCCWQTTFAYHRWVKSSDQFTAASENDYAFLVQFYFKGLGQVGSKLNELLTRGIPGYVSLADRP
jgi:LPS-assembly protein